MPVRSEYKPGTPCWVSLSSPEIPVSAKFYEQLFGWRFVVAGDPAQTGGFGFLMQQDHDVAGIGPVMDSAPSAWTTFISVTDAAQTAEAVKAAGGRVLFEPMQVLDVGHMAVFADPAGAVFAVWQPLTYQGAGIVSESVSFTWNELTTRDIDGSKAFYAAVFGWRAEHMPMPSGMNYFRWMCDGEQVAGMIEMDDKWPPAVPAHWMVYFAVADADATAAKAAELGGSVAVEPFDISVGREAVLTDPFGATFSVIKMAETHG
ncbi:MAG: VOC family protein [Thermoleophilia bacterium]|nr:VOC family protein [Thermoleophilia bacterium]